MFEVMPKIDDEFVKVSNKIVKIEDRKVPLPSPGDYVIVWQEEGKSKKLLAQVNEVHDGIMNLTLENERYNENCVSENYPYKYLLFNLGKNPTRGNVYGVKIDLWLETKNSNLGGVHFFEELDKEEKKILKKALDYGYKFLDKYNMTHFLPLEIHVRCPSGKMTGSYKYRNNKIDILTVKPKNWENASLLICHELAHAIELYYLSDNERKKWIEMYHDSISVKPADIADIERICKDFTDKGESYEEYGEVEKIFKDILNYIEEKHKLTRKDLELLLNNGNKDFVYSIWPSKADISDQEMIITEYAMTDWKEFFCESMSYYANKRKLPAKIKKLIKTTLKKVKGRLPEER